MAIKGNVRLRLKSIPSVPNDHCQLELLRNVRCGQLQISLSDSIENF